MLTKPYFFMPLPFHCILPSSNPLHTTKNIYWWVKPICKIIVYVQDVMFGKGALPIVSFEVICLQISLLCFVHFLSNRGKHNLYWLIIKFVIPICVKYRHFWHTRSKTIIYHRLKLCLCQQLKNFNSTLSKKPTFIAWIQFFEITLRWE